MILRLTTEHEKAEHVERVPGVADHISYTQIPNALSGTCGSGLQPGHVTDWQGSTCSVLLRVRAEAPTHTFQHCRIPVRHGRSHLCITMWSPPDPHRM